MTTEQLDALKAKWDRRYRLAENHPPHAAQVLQDFCHLLPRTGEALDLACGLGGNALLLAKAGLSVQAWDLSPVAVASLQSRAEMENLSVQAAVRDVLAAPPAAETFDVIVISYFLERALAPAICAALRPGGLLFYQTFVRDNVTLGRNPQGPTNPEFLLAENELLAMFAALQPRVYREEGRLGDLSRGLRNEAFLVGKKMPKWKSSSLIGVVA